MNSFAIVTESTADLPPELVDQLELQIIPMRFTFQQKERQDWPDHRELPLPEFYRLLRQGEMGTTSALNPHDYQQALTPLLPAGRDVLLLTFSSGLSSSRRGALLAAQQLRQDFPQRQLEVVDTLAASFGQGLLAWHAARLRREGCSLSPPKRGVEATRLHRCPGCPVDDLHPLKRGGRGSAAAALGGTMLSIKPILHVDGQGHLIPVSKVRGRGASIRALVDRVEQLAIDPAGQPLFISHADCPEDGETLARLLRERFGTENILISSIGPVIGVHCGPGTLAVYFLGKER
ncbi:MAG: DegV family protein [Oscillospiraceae bacterium]|nr:DegV family protein [Oscillospiraceae bacterium]